MHLADGRVKITLDGRVVYKERKKTIRRDDERIDVVVDEYDPELPPLPLGPPVSKTVG